jgi:hypothetical protein
MSHGNVELCSSGPERRCYPPNMYIGTSIFLIALAAILAFAVNVKVAGIELRTSGVIL